MWVWCVVVCGVWTDVGCVGGTFSQVFALQRWQPIPTTGVLSLPLRVDSQDTWMFQAPLPLPPDMQPTPFAELVARFAADSGTAATHSAGDAVNPFGFEVGRPRCDNRVAALLAQAGLTVRNPALDVVTVHVHSVTAESHSAGDNISGAGAVVPLAEQLFIAQ